MIHDDKLKRGERIRLECLNQAMRATQIVATAKPTLEYIFSNAEKIEKWLKQAKEDHH